eukprot:6092569-Amphidinium_carterae.1
MSVHYEQVVMTQCYLQLEIIRTSTLRTHSGDGSNCTFCARDRSVAMSVVCTIVTVTHVCETAHL